jgi:phytoene synthase
MTPADAYQWCETQIRAHDPDRYLAGVFAPQVKRASLFALYAFQHEIAKTAERVSEPILGAIRLEWWHETIDGLYAGQTRQHEVALALAETIAAHDLPRGLFNILIEAREHDLEERPFADTPALLSYAEASSSPLMMLALRVLGAGNAYDETAREAGIAYGITGLLRAFPYWASRRRLRLPQDHLLALGIDPEDVFAGEAGMSLAPLLAEMTQLARAHLARASEARVTRAILPALLPAAVLKLYLSVIAAEDFDPFRHAPDIPRFLRQWAMLRVYMRGSL